MTLPAFATVEDLEARMGQDLDASRASTALEDASNLIRSEASPETWVDGETGEVVDDLPGIVKTVCLRAARRSLENPRGVSTQMESVIGYQRSETFSDSSPDVYLTRGERRDIRRAAGKSTIGTLATSRGELETRHVNAGYDGPPLGDW